MEKKTSFAKKIIKTGCVIIMVAAGACIFTDTNSIKEASAAVKKPTVRVNKSKLYITMNNGTNSYEKAKIKLIKNKKITIKSTKYTIKNTGVATVNKKGIITANHAGKTKLTATIKYKNKTTAAKKLKTKKVTVNITVKIKRKADIRTTGMSFDSEGRAEVFHPFTPHQDETRYSNRESYILRFPVYVETDHDTDADGKRDLIMAYVQLPLSAARGDYKAPVIMKADPYFALGRGGMMNEMATGFNLNSLEASPDKRTPKERTTTIEAAYAASDWAQDMMDTWLKPGEEADLDYYLVRGFAAVISAGLGSYGSEGLQLCGERIEAEAYAAIIEWLAGDRQGFSDPEGTKSIEADWCSGHTALTGLSYVGTMAYEVATLGVKGLDTVIPEGAIGSWYDYINSQGLCMMDSYGYTSYLGSCFSTRYQNEDIFETDLYKRYQSYTSYINNEAAILKGRYGALWERYDFSEGADKPVPALLVQGLNDMNVTTKQARLIVENYQKHNAEIKVILHQGGHERLNYYGEGEMSVAGEYYDDLVNRWLSYYLCGVESGVRDIKNYTIQSNVDGSWTSADEWDGDEQPGIFPENTDAESVLEYSYGSDEDYEAYSNKAWLESGLDRKTDSVISIKKQMDEDTTIAGRSDVHLRVKLKDVMKNNPAMSVMLVDEADEEFDAYVEDPDDPNGMLTTEGARIRIGDGLREVHEVSFKQERVKRKLITQGWINLLYPGAGWEPESSKDPGVSISPDTYYNYTVCLMPTYYTVKKGHRLCIYILPYSGANLRIYEESILDKPVTEPTNDVIYDREYAFTVDNKNSYIKLRTH